MFKKAISLPSPAWLKSKKNTRKTHLITERTTDWNPLTELLNVLCIYFWRGKASVSLPATEAAVAANVPPQRSNTHAGKRGRDCRSRLLCVVLNSVFYVLIFVI